MRNCSPPAFARGGVLLLCVAPARCDEVITGLALIDGKGAACPQNYDEVLGSQLAGAGDLNGDLNQDAFGDPVYLCAKKGAAGSAQAITGLEVAAGENNTCQNNWARIWQVAPSDGDMNQGGGGSYLYLCYTVDPSMPALGSLNLRSSGCDPGMYRVGHINGSDGDLNQGKVFGKYIYLCRGDATLPPSNSTPMSNPAGFWDSIESSNQGISWSLTTGTSWEQSTTCTKTDALSLSDALEAGGEFLGVGIKATVEAEVKQEWSAAVSSSATHSVSTECTATCLASNLPNGSAGWALYQWQYSGSNTVQGTLTSRSCNYLCIPKPLQQPLCPLNCCADRWCQTCTAGCLTNATEFSPRNLTRAVHYGPAPRPLRAPL